jgi:hypothetical protein
MIHITPKDMIAELRREIGLRKRLYPAWWAEGKLDRAEGERRIAVMQAILHKLEEEMKANAPELPL